MAIYKGFSTQGLCSQQRYNLPAGSDGELGDRSRQYRTSKGFALTDAELVRRDLLNAFQIRQGTKVGRPQYGTTLWDFIFEPNTPDVQAQITQEIQRIVSEDPRIAVGEIRAFPEENGILIEMEVSFEPDATAEVLSVFFDRESGQVA